MADSQESPSRIRFSQRMSSWQAISRGLGVVVPAAVFVLLGETTAAAGPLVFLTFVLAALLVIINGLGYAELAVRTPRRGGAYSMIHDGPSALTYVAGWALAFSGLGLSGLLAQGAARYVFSLANALLGLAIPAHPLAMAMVALVVLVNGLRKWERSYLRYTIPAVTLLIVVTLAAVPRIDTAHYGAARQQLGPAAVMLIVAFVGLEIISGHQGEIRHRAANFPRALLIAPALAALLGAAVAFVAVGVIGPESAHADLPLSAMGMAVAGVSGRIIVLTGGLVVLLLALGRALNLVVRNLYVMSQDGYWPSWLRQVHPRRRTPTRLILIVGLLTLPAVWVPAALLSRIAGLLYLFVLMAVNLTLARRPRQEPGSAFSLPFHPWVPALTMAIDLLVVPLWGLGAVGWTVGCLAVGGLVYLAYGRSRHIEALEGTIIFRPSDQERGPSGFQVLVPIANPATAGALLRMAGRIAKDRNGHVLALQVVIVPEPVPLESGRRRAQAAQALLEEALEMANEEDLPIQTVVRVARTVAQGVLDTATEGAVDLILLGWRGPARSRGASLGSVVDAVLHNAPCDVMVMRGEHVTSPQRILVPTAGGPHARAAARLALSLSRAFQAQPTLVSIQKGPATPRQMEEGRHRILETLEGLEAAPPPETKVVLAQSVTEGIVDEAKDHDLVLLGMSEETLLDRLVFGSIPLQVATRVPATALVQGYRGLTGIWSRWFVRTLREALPALSHEEQLEVQQEISRGAQPGTNYFVLIVLSCIIAALGLLLNSPAVVIGAMLVAPLMSPILAFSLGLVLGDLRLIRFSTEAISKGVALAAILAAFIGLLSPLKIVTDEMLARGQPTLLDLAVALVSGMAGAYALARKDVSAALPGVAIAAALMPPLATVGLGLSLGNVQVAGGAFLLFATNIAAISLAGGIVFVLLGIRPRRWGAESRRKLQQRLIASFLLLLAIAVPLGILLDGIVRTAEQEQAVRAALIQYLATEDGELVSLEIERSRDDLGVVATVRSVQPVRQETVDNLAEVLSGQLDRPVRLTVVTLPIVRSE